MDKVIVKCFLLVSGLFLLNSCVSFSKSNFKNDLKKINKNNLKILNGTYNYYPLKNYSFKNDSIIRKINVYDLVNNARRTPNKVKINKLDLLESENENGTQEFEITVIDNYTIEIRHTINGKVIAKNQIKGKLKKSGLFHLENKYYERRGIPYLFGGASIAKGRIGITKNYNLIFNGAYSNEGAILLFLAAGSRYNSAYEIERIK